MHSFSREILLRWWRGGEVGQSVRYKFLVSCSAHFSFSPENLQTGVMERFQNNLKESLTCLFKYQPKMWYRTKNFFFWPTPTHPNLNLVVCFPLLEPFHMRGRCGGPDGEVRLALRVYLLATGHWRGRKSLPQTMEDVYAHCPDIDGITENSKKHEMLRKARLAVEFRLNEKDQAVIQPSKGQQCTKYLLTHWGGSGSNFFQFFHTDLLIF